METPMRCSEFLEVKQAADLCTRAFAFEVRASGENGEIEGYGSVFGIKDSYSDIVMPGAFVASIAEHKAAGTMPAMLWQHDQDEPIGVWTEMEEDAKGLRVKGQIITETEKGKAAYALLKKGALRGLSIGFVSKEWSYDAQSEIRTLTAVDLWEVSLVTFPAMKLAMIDTVKNMGRIDAPKDAERILREAGFSKADATAIVSGVMRLGEERREAAYAAAEVKAAAERLLKLFP
jgi:HK97 family phage prohead protease